MKKIFTLLALALALTANAETYSDIHARLIGKQNPSTQEEVSAFETRLKLEDVMANMQPEVKKAIDYIHESDTVYMNEDGGLEYKPNKNVAYMFICDLDRNILTIQEVNLLNPDYIQTRTCKVKVTTVVWHNVLVNVNYHGQRGQEWKEVPEITSHMETKSYEVQVEEPRWEISDSYNTRWEYVYGNFDIERAVEEAEDLMKELDELSAKYEIDLSTNLKHYTTIIEQHNPQTSKSKPTKATGRTRPKVKKPVENKDYNDIYSL